MALKNNKEKRSPVTKQNKPVKSNGWIKQNSSFVYISIIILLTLIVYSNSFKNGFVLLDDDAKVIGNPLITNLGFSNIIKYFFTFVFHTYMPLTILSYAIDYSIWGLNPWAYHTINILLHIFNSIILFVIVRKLTERTNAAFFASLLFALHPMNVETVSWISERSNLLYTALFLVSLFFYVKHINGSSVRKNIYFSFLFFILSAFAKPSAVVLPLVLILIDYFKGIKINLKNLLQKVLFFLISLLFGIVTIYATIVTENIREVSSVYNFTDRIFLLIYPVACYIIKFIAPFHLSALHPFPVKVNGILPWEYYASVIFLLGIIFLIIRNKKFRKELIFGTLFFMANISIFLTSVPTGGNFLVVEHFVYVPYIGFAIITGLFFSRVFDNPINLEHIKKIAPYFITVVLILFSLITYNRNFVWKNSKSLCSDMIKKSPDNAFGYYGLATSKFDDMDYDGAIEEYNKAIKIDSAYVDAYYNRALAEKELEKFGASLADFNKTILLNPKKYVAYSDRGNVKLIIEDTAGALSDYNSALKLNPEYSCAYYNRGNVKLNKIKYNEALADYTKAVELDKNYTDAYNNRGIVKYYLKDFSGSIKDYDKAIELNAKSAMTYKNRGLSKLALKDTTAACDDFYKASSFGFKPANSLIKKYCK